MGQIVLKNKTNKIASNSPNKKVISQTFREAILLLSFSVSSFIYLTLTTYQKNDSSWIKSSSTEIQNLGGLFGSYLSETLYFVFGQAAFLIPLIIIFLAIIIYKKDNLNGLWLEKHENGATTFVGYFRDGRPSGLISQWEHKEGFRADWKFHQGSQWTWKDAVNTNYDNNCHDFEEYRLLKYE